MCDSFAGDGDILYDTKLPMKVLESRRDGPKIAWGGAITSTLRVIAEPQECWHVEENSKGVALGCLAGR